MSSWPGSMTVPPRSWSIGWDEGAAAAALPPGAAEELRFELGETGRDDEALFHELLCGDEAVLSLVAAEGWRIPLLCAVPVEV